MPVVHLSARPAPVVPDAPRRSPEAPPPARTLPRALVVLGAVALGVHALPHLLGTAGSWSGAGAGDCAANAIACENWFDLPTAVDLVVGGLWAVAALAYLVTAVLLLRRSARAGAWLLGTTVLSTALCLVSLPGARVGLAIDAAILAGLAVGALRATRVRRGA